VSITDVFQKGRNPGLPCTFRKVVRALSRAPQQRQAGAAAFLLRAWRAGREAVSNWRKKNAVYVVTVSEAFTPQRPWDLPESIAGAELYAKNLLLTAAQEFCRVFNKRQMQLRMSERRWALAIKHTRCRAEHRANSSGHRLPSAPPDPAGSQASVEVTIRHPAPQSPPAPRGEGGAR
jgi:hypothetical protein